MAIRTIGDVKRHLQNLDIDTRAKRLGLWLDETLKSMPEEVVALSFEWDMVGGDDHDEIMGDLFGYKHPGLDPASPTEWDWSSDDQRQYHFVDMGAIWSKAVEELPDEEIDDAEEAIAGALDEIIARGVDASEQMGKRLQNGKLRFYLSRHDEEPRELRPGKA